MDIACVYPEGSPGSCSKLDNKIGQCTFTKLFINSPLARYVRGQLYVLAPSYAKKMFS